MSTMDEPLRFPLATTMENRGTNTNFDTKLVNGYLEKQQSGEYEVYKRPGYLENPVYSTRGGMSYGIYNWLDDIYQIVNGVFYKNLIAIGAVSNAGTQYFFSPIDATTPYLFFCNGTHAYTYNISGGLVEVTADLPGGLSNGTCYGCCYLDGTLYIGLFGFQQIYGSNINDVTVWNSLNVIKAQIEPDNLVAIGKHLVYLVAFKNWTTEIFYDAANSAGSPLGPIQGAKINYGCVASTSVREIDGDLFWVGAGKDGMPRVLTLHNLEATVVSTPPVERLLDQQNLPIIYAWCYEGNGHRFYVLSIATIGKTLAYDIDEKLWFEWATQGKPFMTIGSSIGRTGSIVMQDIFTGYVYDMGIQFLTDNGTPIVLDLYTPNFDAGVDRRKTLNMLRFTTDQTPGSILQVRCNDHDYSMTKWTNFRQVDLGKQRPFLTNCGTFYRRAYHLQHSSATALRLTAMDMQLDIGTL